MPGAFDGMATQREAIDNIGALTDQERKTAAYNALNTTYGPAIAYDPTNAFNAAKASVAQQTAPTEVQSAQEDLKTKQLSNTEAAGNQQRLAAYRAAAMLQSQAQPDGSIPQNTYDTIVRPNAGLLGIDPAHVDDFGKLLSQPGGAQHLQTIMQALIGPTKLTGNFTYGTDANGNPVAIGKDQYGNVVQRDLNGSTPVPLKNAETSASRAQTYNTVQPERVRIAQQNANTAAYSANTRSNNSTNGNPGGILPQGGGARPAAGPVAAPGTAPAGGANAVPPDSLFARLPVGSRQRSIAIGQATQIVNQGSNLQNTNQILDTVMKQISPYTAGTGSLIKDLPGTQQADLKANLRTLEAQGLTSWINSLKNAQGQTGIGRVLQSEAKAAMTLFGNMEQDQSAKQLAFHAQLFRRAVNALYQHAQEGFHTTWQADPYAVLGETAPPASGGGLPQGWTYLGARKQ